MTDAPLSRAFVSDIELSRADSAGRTITGIVVPFGKIATVSDGGRPYREAFQHGAFSQALGHMRGDYRKVKLLAQHARSSNPLGRATLLREDAAGLYGEFIVSKTRAGDDALELVRDGAIDSFSVGFAPIKHAKRGDVTWRTETGINEASLVTFPAYADAGIQSVRSLDDLTDEQRDTLMLLLEERAHILRPTHPDGDDEAAGTSTEGAPTDEAASPLRSVTAKKLAFLNALIEREIK